MAAVDAGRSLSTTAGLAASSLACRLYFKAHGVHPGRLTCEGQLPVLTTGGDIRIQQLALRNRAARSEVGARPGASLHIGRNVFVNQGASLVAHLAITVEDDVRIGDFAAIYDSDHHQIDASRPMRSAPVHLGVGCWIGRGAIVLPGVTVGAHSVVASGSVVTRPVPDSTLVAGNPAQVVRDLEIPAGWVRA